MKPFFFLLLLTIIPASAHAAYPSETFDILTQGFWNETEYVFGAQDEGGDFELRDEGGGLVLAWFSADPEPTEGDIELLRKPYWAKRQSDEIDVQQELRSRTALISAGAIREDEPFFLPRVVFPLMEEWYLDILLPASRRSITETDTPITWALKALRDDRNDLRSLLATQAGCVDVYTVAACDGPATADQIRDFDIECTKTNPSDEGLQECGLWDGWSYPLTEAL